MMTPHFNSFGEFLHMGGLGVYVWTCEIELIDGSRAVFSGDVTLVR